MTLDLGIAQPESPHARRIEELGRIILAYSEVTERMQQSQEQLHRTVDHLRTELSEKNKLLERKNRLAAVGEMAAGMAHEIRNPLGGIQLYASMLAQDLVDRPASHDLVMKVSKGVKRIESIVSQVLQFSRDVRVNMSECDLAEIVHGTVELTAGRAPDVKREIVGPDSLRVVIDPVLIGQSVLNLVLNALEAMEENQRSGTVRIEYAAPPAGSDAKQLHLLVRDGGPGIPADVLDRIFNPFFTTKDSGTGLGLSIVHRVTEAHDGTITACNVEADGGVICGVKFEVRI